MPEEQGQAWPQVIVSNSKPSEGQGPHRMGLERKEVLKHAQAVHGNRTHMLPTRDGACWRETRSAEGAPSS